MSEKTPPGPPPAPPANLSTRKLPLRALEAGTLLYRIHRGGHDPLHFGRHEDPVRRHRWDSPGARYGVCYAAMSGEIAFAESLLRDLTLEAVHEDDLRTRCLALLEVRGTLRLVEMNGRHLRRLGADASVVHASYDVTWAWSAALRDHPDAPDGIRYRARHDDSGYSVALFDRAREALHVLQSTPLTDPSLAADLARWLDRYQVGLTG